MKTSPLSNAGPPPPGPGSAQSPEAHHPTGAHPQPRSGDSVRAGVPMPRLSLCLIARDGALHPDCLASVARVVDELVVVDTGSTDDTVAVAQAAGAQVVHHPWADDFAAAERRPRGEY